MSLQMINRLHLVQAHPQPEFRQSIPLWPPLTIDNSPTRNWRTSTCRCWIPSIFSAPSRASAEDMVVRFTSSTPPRNQYPDQWWAQRRLYLGCRPFCDSHGLPTIPPGCTFHLRTSTWALCIPREARTSSLYSPKYYNKTGRTRLYIYEKGASSYRYSIRFRSSLDSCLGGYPVGFYMDANIARLH